MSDMISLLRSEAGMLGEEAADHIEYLDKKNDLLIDERDAITKDRDEYRTDMNLALSRLDAAEKLVERLVETLQQCHDAIDPINHIHLNQMAQEKFGKRILYANDLLPILEEAAKWRERK